MREFPPTHPDKILFEEFLKPMGIDRYRLAKDIGVSPMGANKIVFGQRLNLANSRENTSYKNG
jgi:plasmid maintenance system antidote protein VapI